MREEKPKSSSLSTLPQYGHGKEKRQEQLIKYWILKKQLNYASE